MATESERTILSRYASHMDLLVRVNNTVNEQKSLSKQSNLFSQEVTRQLDEYINLNSPEIYNTFGKFYHKLCSLENTKAPGHDLPHLVDVLNSGVRILRQFPDLSEAQHAEVLVSILMHDLGRYAESVWHDPRLTSRDVETLYPLIVGRSLQRSFGAPPSEFGRRVLYDIATGSEPKTDILTADIVHQSDREQLIGTATILRGLAFDVGVAQRDLGIPLESEFCKKLPLPETDQDKYWLIQYEFFMRNIYPPISADGPNIISNIKRENAVILMLAMEGGDPKLFDQVFAPELGIINPEDPALHWSKKVLPAEIFEQAMWEEKEFLDRVVHLGTIFPSDIAGLVEFTRRAIETEMINLPNNFEHTMRGKLEKLGEQERINYWKILVYTLVKRHQKRRLDIESLHNIAMDGNGFLSTAADLITQELTLRQAIFEKNFPTLQSIADLQ